MITVQQLDEKHPAWSDVSSYWADVELLYQGGAKIRREAERFLVSRPAEPKAVYQSRLKRFSYQNILGSALGWYASKLFSEPVKFTVQGKPDTYLEEFVVKADRTNTLQKLCRNWFIRAALDGYVYVLVDLPGVAGATTWREQRGQLNPFLTTFGACQATNWSCDESGELEWIVFSASGHGAGALGARRAVVDRWYYFDRETFTIYESTRESKASEKREVRIVAGPAPHAFADIRRVPVRKIALPEDLWLANRVYLQVLDHLNEDNALSWKLLMSNLAVPVIIGERFDETNAIGETAYLKLTQGSDFKWSEPEGKNFEYSIRRIDSLIEEIYRQMYLQAHAKKSSATASAQSGWSKEIEMQPAVDVLNGYGVIFRAVIAELLADVAQIRSRTSERPIVDVQGLTFQEAELNQLDDASLAVEQVDSLTWKKYVQKRVVDIYAPQLDPPLRQQIHTEIDSQAAPPAPQLMPNPLPEAE